MKTGNDQDEQSRGSGGKQAQSHQGEQAPSREERCGGEERGGGEEPTEQDSDHQKNDTVGQSTTNITTSSTTTSKPKKKINRSLASCLGCRKRKTRCDRDRPCSECFKRNLSCDYSGAISPPIVIRRRQADEVERDEYVKLLEARLRALEQAISLTRDPSPPPVEEKQDFSVDDLAAQLSTTTIGQRVRCGSRSSQPHPLQLQVEQLLSSRPAVPRTTFIQPELQFSLNLVASNPIPSLEELSDECLPQKTDIEFLAEHFFNSINLWSSCLNRTDWKAQLDAFWNTTDRLLFRPSPPSQEPPHLTQHYLAQFLSTVYGVMAHGLLALADIHHLDSAPDNQSNSDSAASSPSHESLWSLSQAEKISLANRWFRFSLGLLVSPVGDIYVKPTVFGVRAMSVLSNVELAPENLDHGIFFWTLTTNVATSAGLHREPPITDDEVLETLDQTEIESRRWLAWHILSLDWAGHSISGGIRPRSDPDQFTVKMPATVPSPMIPLHPIDGWPLDPLICVHKVSAVSDRLMQRANNKIHNATYQDVLEIQRQYDEIQNSIPPRLQCKLSANGKSLEPAIKDNPIPFLILAFLRTRFCIARIRLLRLFIFPKKGCNPEERSRQMEALLRVSREHFLGVQQFSHTLNMHPLLIYSLVNTAVACALVLLIDHQTRGLGIDEDFFLTELNKVIDLFSLGKKTMAATMASRAVRLLQTLVRLIESGVDPTGCKSLDRRKKGPGVALNTNATHKSVDANDEGKKRRKLQSDLTTWPPGSSGSRPLPFEIGIHSYSPPESGLPIRQETSFQPSSTFVSFSHPSSSAAIQFIGSAPMVNVTSQTTPPLVSSQPLQRSTLSNSSSTSHLSPHHHPTPQQSNFSHLRRVARLPHHLDEVTDAEFGAMDSKLTDHQFNFSIFDHILSGTSGIQTRGIVPGGDVVDDSIRLSDVIGHELSFQFQQTSSEELYSRGLGLGNISSESNLEPFQPTFHFDPGAMN